MKRRARNEDEGKKMLQRRAFLKNNFEQHNKINPNVHKKKCILKSEHLEVVSDV